MAASSRSHNVDASSPHETAPGISSLRGLDTILKVVAAASVLVLVGFLIGKSKQRRSNEASEEDECRPFLSPTAERSYDLRDPKRPGGAKGGGGGGGLIKFFSSKLGLESSRKKEEETAAESGVAADLEARIVRP